MATTVREYLAVAFRWQRGRQGTGYDKMLLLTAPWPVPFDSYLLRYPDGCEVPPHTDRVAAGRHYRLNAWPAGLSMAKPSPAPKRVGEIASFIAMLRAACENRLVYERLEALLTLPDLGRQAALHAWAYEVICKCRRGQGR